MGGRDSKPSFITYEDAIKRVTDSELKRLKDAFKRTSTLNGYMTKQIFIREVLGDGVPIRLAEQMYLAFGGTQKGLGYKDLVCGLVLLTRGRQEEKIKFMFGLYANENLTHVQKELMDKLVLATEGQVPQAFSQLFYDNDQVTYEMFRAWVISNQSATSVTRWLLKEPCSVTLSNDTETPTFYQTLAGVTHLEETDIIELEKRYWLLKAQSKTGRFDLETFKHIISPPVPDAVCEGLFYAFDENRDNHIDFKEMACGVSACCRGPSLERQKFCFKLFDEDHDSLLSRKELENMIEVMLIVRKENKSLEDLGKDMLKNVSPVTLAAEILEKHDTDNDDCIAQEEYLVWTVGHPLPTDFLSLLFQISHVVLGLKTQTKEDEGKVISGWLDREERRGLKSGQVWYLVSMNWWRQWLEYVNIRPLPPLPEGAHSNGNGSLRRTPSGSRASSLCRNLGRKSSIGLEDSGGGVVGTSYTSVYDTSSPENTNSPTKYATLPKASPNHSPHHANLLANDVNMSPSRSWSTNSSPAPSPKLGKRGLAHMAAPKPGAIDNTSLITPNTTKVMTLTNEGGRLKRDKMLIRGRDFELLPEPVWKALSTWYGGSPSLPRTVITSLHGDPTPELELYPITVKLLRHQTQQQRQTQNSTFTGMIGGIGGMAMTTAGFTPSQPTVPRRYLAYLSAFSRKHTLRQVYEFLAGRLRISKEDMRLWKFKDEHNMTLLEEEEFTMEHLGIEENMQILIEVRNKDLTWPEEMSQLAKNKASIDKKVQVPTERGATGLNNLGNTCFMNSAVQCVSNTRILTLYFTGGMHLYELNRTNVLGMKGHIAQRYGELVKDLWSGTTKSIAPLKLRWTIGKYAPRFNGFQQHDSQEFLAFLLDGLHEDLNRVHNKPYVELKDSDGRPDVVVAKEAWDNHLIRNKSVIVDLFHGQLKSQVSCLECQHTSVRFDPFTYLSLPLPMDSCIHLEIIVMRLDGSVPIKFGVRLNMDEKYKTLKKALSALTKIPHSQLLLVEVFGALVKGLPQDNQKIKTLLGGNLYAYELPPVPEILPMTVLEERESIQNQSPKTQCGLSQIQRMHNNNNNTVRNENSMVNCVQNGEKIQKGSPGHAKLTNGNSSLHSQSQTNHQTSGQALTNGNPTNSKLPNGSVSDTPTATTSTPSNSSTGHQRNSSNTSSVSSVNGNSSNSTSPTASSLPETFSGFVVAVHRKMIRMDVYFLSSQKSRPSLFGTPLILPCDDKSTHQDLYQCVWTQVSRLVSPLPPSEAGTPNHAQDCDDSLGYEYPFTLKVVQKDGLTCAWCPWYRFCRGCKLECTTADFNFGSAFIAVDWEPTALHLRYQTSQERVYDEHVSVEESRRLQTEPIDLDTCLKAFTKEEELGEDELYYCSKCKKHRLAAKKLEIWKLPPILIIHLKRFQFLNGRWVKSQKIVKFPHKNFDPRSYVAPRINTSDSDNNHSTTITSKLSNANGATNHNTKGNKVGTDLAQQNATITEGNAELKAVAPLYTNGPVVNGVIETNSLEALSIKSCSSHDNTKTSTKFKSQGKPHCTNDVKLEEVDEELTSEQKSLGNHSVTESGDGTNKHKAIKVQPKPSESPFEGVENGKGDGDVEEVIDISSNDRSLCLRNSLSEDYTAIRYNLYAISCHTGILGGGHYVSYGRNPNNKWYCYNDSSCKEVPEEHVDSDSAYILFYQQDNLDCGKYMPDITGKEPDTADIEDEFENDLKKMCVVQ